MVVVFAIEDSTVVVPADYSTSEKASSWSWPSKDTTSRPDSYSSSSTVADSSFRSW